MNKLVKVTIMLIFGLWVAACSAPAPTQATISTPAPDETALAPTDPVSQTEPSATNPPPTPTATPLPVAFTVNGEPIAQARYRAELDRFQAALGEDIPLEEASTRVLDMYVNQILLAQAATAQGFSLTQEMVDVRINTLVAELGDQAQFDVWLAENGFTLEQFREELALQIPAAWMRDQILAEAPTSGEQVRARHILVRTEAEAQRVLAQLNSGTSFDVLLTVYDPIALGELGWFPRGYIFQPELEDIAFALDVETYSDIIATELGYHVLQTTDRADNRPFSPDVLLFVQQQTLENWLREKRSQSSIDILLP